MSLLIVPFHDPATRSFSYVVTEPVSRACAVIDPVLDFDSRSRTTTTRSADQIASFVRANGLIVEWLLETHVHADHLSAARYLKSRFVCAQMGIGAGIATVRKLIDPGAPEPDTVFDRLFGEGDQISVGHLTGRVMATPGHTPACVSYVFDDAVFVGDTLFRPDYGSARCDFPGGDAAELYRSARRLLSAPNETRLFLCHDYPEAGQSPCYLSTVAEQRTGNVHLHDGVSGPEFVALRKARDALLTPPALFDPAVKFNLGSGVLADAAALESGTSARGRPVCAA